jgi:hypothetical protein
MHATPKTVTENTPEPRPSIEPEKVVVMYRPLSSILHLHGHVHIINLEKLDHLSGCGGTACRGSSAGGSSTGLGPIPSVIVIETNWLVKVHRNLGYQTTADELGSSDNGSDEQSQKENEQGEVENSVSPDTSLP